MNISNLYFPDQVKQYQKIHGLRKAISTTSKKGNSIPSDYFLEFSCGRGGSADENKKSFLSSLDLEPNQEFSQKKIMIEEEENEIQNLDEKISKNVMNISSLKSVVLNQNNSQYLLKQTPTNCKESCILTMFPISQRERLFVDFLPPMPLLPQN